MKATLRVILSVALAVPFAALAACDETIPITPAPPSSDAGSDATAEASAPGLFQKLGGEPGIAKFVDAVVAAEVADPEIASYFAPNTLATPPAGKPTVAQIKECLVKQIANAAGGKDASGAAIAYPTTVSGGYQCRNMAAAHASLHIGSGLFDKFAAIAVTVAKGSGLPDSDLATIKGFLDLQKTDVVDESAPDGGFFDAGSTPTDSGTDAPVDAPSDGG